jgi:hypothetical protein
MFYSCLHVLAKILCYLLYYCVLYGLWNVRIELFLIKMCIFRLLMIFHKRGTPMPAWKRWLSRSPGIPLSRLLVFFAGIFWIKTERPKFDYKKYLGPDWKPKYTGASTLLFNHTTWTVHTHQHYSFNLYPTNFIGHINWNVVGYACIFVLKICERLPRSWKDF